MLKKLIMIGCSALCIASSGSNFADTSCEIQVAIASPPIDHNFSVAFNITNDIGLSKSVIVPAGNPAKTIGNIICTPSPYAIGATLFATEGSALSPKAIGECSLKAGYLVLSHSNSSASVVFPYDFNCNF